MIPARSVRVSTASSFASKANFSQPTRSTSTLSSRTTNGAQKLQTNSFATAKNSQAVFRRMPMMGAFAATAHTPVLALTQSVQQRTMAKVKLTPAQKSAKEKAQHAKLVEEVMNKLDEPEFAYVNHGQREAIKAHTNLVIVLHMVLDDVKEFKKRLDTWCSWNPGTPGVFSPKKTEEEKKAEREAAAAAAAAAEAEANAAAGTTAAKAVPKETPRPAAAPKRTAPKEEEEETDDAIVPEDAEAAPSGPFELRDFLKRSGLSSKSIESVYKKLSDAGFEESTLSEVNDAYLKKLGIPQPERQQVLKGAFDWISKHPSSD